MDWNRTVVTAGISLAIGTGLGYYLVPTKVTVKTVEKIVEHRDVVTVTVTKPDGTKVTTTNDKTVVDTGKSTVKITEKEKQDWLLSAGYLRGMDAKSEIVGSIQRRIIGETYVGIIGSSHRTIGLVITMRF